MDCIAHVINNQHVNSVETLDVLNPATNEVCATVAIADKSIVDQAVNAAQEAFSAWAHTSPLNRSRVLFNFNELLKKHHDDLAKLIVREHGKVFSDAKAEVTRGREVVEFACGIPELLKGEYTASVGTNVDSYSYREPLGVVVGITPFNFPAMVPLWMFPVALACGNTFILKPSEQDPSIANFMADLLKQAGLPDGVFNVVHGNKKAVESLIDHELVKAISFVGSTPVAKAIVARSRPDQRVQALGGAKNHMVVLPDADLDNAVNALMGAAYGSAGERCMAISVTVAVGDVADSLVAQLTSNINSLKIGDGMAQNPENEMGPLISEAHLTKVSNYIQLGIDEGAVCVVDGREVALPDQGNFLGATLFDHVSTDMKIWQEEIFGPVLCVIRVNTLDEAIALINSHHFANGTSIFTQSGAMAKQFSRQIQVGMVGVNVPIPVPMAFHSFGGFKQSLFGDIKMHGPEGVRFYTQQKTITERWVPNLSRNQFVMPT